jgi:hypothetical protein
MSSGVSGAELQIPEDQGALQEFYSREVDERITTLYESYDAETGTLTLAPGFEPMPFWFRDSLRGDALNNAQTAWDLAKEEAIHDGGPFPKVRALVKDGQTFAYTIESSAFGLWQKTQVFDRNFERMKEFLYIPPGGREPSAVPANFEIPPSWEPRSGRTPLP